MALGLKSKIKIRLSKEGIIMAGWKAYLTDNTSRYLNELFEFLRIPSISSLPEHAADVKRAAEWPRLLK